MFIGFEASTGKEQGCFEIGKGRQLFNFYST